MKNWSKNIIFTIVLIIIIFFSVEIILGYLLWHRKVESYSSIHYTIKRVNKYFLKPKFWPDNKITHTIFLPKSPYVPDSYLGYSDLPGEYLVSWGIEGNDKKHQFRVTINNNGNRITTFHPELYENKKEIWIFGNSNTFGWGNNDETTFPFILQNFLEDFQIINFADNGYGNIHAYLKLKKEIDLKSPPRFIVIVYGDYFNIRNVAAPSRLKEYNLYNTLWRDDLLLFTHPRANIIDNELKIDYVQLSKHKIKNIQESDPEKTYQREVTKKILREISLISSKNNVKIILAFISGDDNDSVVEYAMELGYKICDIRASKKYNEHDNFKPYDAHPGPLAQNHYAYKIYNAISRTIESGK